MTEKLLGGKKKQEEDQRTFTVQSYDENTKKYCENGIRTSKYSFIPLSYRFVLWKNLFEQFHRYANCYFLLVATLQLIPGLSPTGRFTTLIPLSNVLFITFLKDAYEDYKRHKRDGEVNNQSVKTFRQGSWQDVKWRDLSVGEIVEISRDVSGGEFPADLILLHSSEEQGLCHIETSNLDGETNLKLRKAHFENPKSSVAPFNASKPGSFVGTLQCEAPNKDLYKFEGKLIRGDRPEDTSAVNFDSILLRGAKLGGSTKKIMGMVVYTGRQSKLMMNQQDSRHKVSNLEATTNSQIIFILGMQLTLCSICAVGLGISTSSFTDHWYLSAEDLNPVTTALTGVGTFIILFNNLIPISLYVSMETVKIIQAQLMGTDLTMYHEESDTPCEARTSSLNEELGQVQYIFSDKTGTLTCNIMDFLKFSVGSQSYGTGTTEIGRAAAMREGRVLHDDRPKSVKPIKGFYFYDEKISDVTGEQRKWNWMSQPNTAEIAHFLKVLAVCHTVVTEEGTDESGKPSLEYTAASPDEACLVAGARFLGVQFAARDATDVTISVNQLDGSKVDEKWKLYEVLEFNSDRKRMSVIVRDPKGVLMLLCKGADSVIFERLIKPKDEHEVQMRKTTTATLERFAEEGLRTLCIAQVLLKEDVYADWSPKYKAAQEAIGGREQKLTEVGEMIEKDLVLIGTTAIEDKLQEGVPATIELLRTAGLNVWVLTGDKQETAINIGFACSLLHNAMKLFKFEEGSSREKVTSDLSKFKDEAMNIAKADPEKDQGVVIQGATLVDITADEAPQVNKDNFLDFTKHCKAVICCRVTPGQKAEVVRIVKEGLGKVTLSIGDGANDVAMITEAHVGIGISGLEGLQAARASDYSIGQFRFLRQLLLVHGRWSYKRVVKVILYSFYKNILLYLTQFWFCLFNSFTGQSLYDRWALASFNVLFTALPIVAVGVLDRDVDPKRIMSLEQFPELYDEGRLSKLFGTKVFWGFTFTAVLQSMMCFFLPMVVLTESVDSSDGRALGMHWMGGTAYTAVVWVVNLKCALETRSFTIANHVVTWGSVGMWYVFLVVYGNLWSTLRIGQDWYGLASMILLDPQHWLTWILVVVIALFRDVVWKFYSRTFRSNLLHKVQDWEALERNGILSDFNYALMQREHPEVLPRSRIKEKPTMKAVAVEEVVSPAVAPITVSNPPMNEAQGSGAHNVQGAHNEMSQQHLQPPPNQPHVAHHHYPYRRHTGFAFSQGPNQVEIMASKIDGTPVWATSARPSRRALKVRPGEVSIGGLVDSSGGSSSGRKTSHKPLYSAEKSSRSPSYISAQPHYVHPSMQSSVHHTLGPAGSPQMVVHSSNPAGQPANHNHNPLDYER